MPRPRGITLTEVIVLLVIGGILLCLAVAGIQQARVKARREHCAERLGQLALGLARYRQAEGDFFPFGTIANEKLAPEQRLSWYVGTWQFVGDRRSKLAVDLRKPWTRNRQHNRMAQGRRRRWNRSPASSAQRPPAE